MKHTNFDEEITLSKAIGMFLQELLQCFAAILLLLFILSLVGSAIWGAEGFVEVLANFF